LLTQVLVSGLKLCLNLDQILCMKHLIAAFTLVISMLLVSCLKQEQEGCTDPLAYNYDPNAVVDNGICNYDSSWSGPYPYTPGNFSGEMYTSYSENWDDWDFKFNGISGEVYTSYSENWDDWDFTIGGVSGSLSTSYSENWDDWNLTTSNYSISIQTSYSENWDDWDIDDDNSSWNADVSTSYTENWDDWDADGDSVNLDIATSYAENWDDWDASGQFGTTLPVEYRIAVLFVPVIVNVLRQQSIIP
jgi:hypothetical protein